MHISSSLEFRKKYTPIIEGWDTLKRLEHTNDPLRALQQNTSDVWGLEVLLSTPLCRHPACSPTCPRGSCGSCRGCASAPLPALAPPALLLPPLCRALHSSLPPRTPAILSRLALLPRSCVSSGKFPNLSGRLFFQLVSLPRRLPLHGDSPLPCPPALAFSPWVWHHSWLTYYTCASCIF